MAAPTSLPSSPSALGSFLRFAHGSRADHGSGAGGYGPRRRPRERSPHYERDREAERERQGRTARWGLGRVNGEQMYENIEDIVRRLDEIDRRVREQGRKLNSM